MFGKVVVIIVADWLLKIDESQKQKKCPSVQSQYFHFLPVFANYTYSLYVHIYLKSWYRYGNQPKLQRNLTYLIVMVVGYGMGVAAVFAREQ